METMEDVENANEIAEHSDVVLNSEGEPICPVESTFDLLSGRWKIRVLWSLYKKSMRFTEIEQSIEGLSAKVLSSRLRELEEIGFITRKEIAGFPPHVEYELTELGLSFAPVLSNVAEWGVNNKSTILDLIEKKT